MSTVSRAHWGLAANVHLGCSMRHAWLHCSGVLGLRGAVWSYRSNMPTPGLRIMAAHHGCCPLLPIWKFRCDCGSEGHSIQYPVARSVGVWCRHAIWCLRHFLEFDRTSRKQVTHKALRTPRQTPHHYQRLFQCASHRESRPRTSPCPSAIRPSLPAPGSQNATMPSTSPLILPHWSPLRRRRRRGSASPGPGMPCRVPSPLEGWEVRRARLGRRCLWDRGCCGSPSTERDVLSMPVLSYPPPPCHHHLPPGPDLPRPGPRPGPGPANAGGAAGAGGGPVTVTVTAAEAASAPGVCSGGLAARWEVPLGAGSTYLGHTLRTVPRGNANTNHLCHLLGAPSHSISSLKSLSLIYLDSQPLLTPATACTLLYLQPSDIWP